MCECRGVWVKDNLVGDLTEDGLALEASTFFRFTLVVILGAVWDRVLPPGGGVLVGPSLKNSSEGQTTSQSWPAAQHGHS